MFGLSLRLCQILVVAVLGVLSTLAAFHRRYPDARGYLQVSAVGFDAEKRRAMVYLAHHRGFLCGGGRHHFLQKVDGIWQTVKPPMASFCQWMS